MEIDDPLPLIRELRNLVNEYYRDNDTLDAVNYYYFNVLKCFSMSVPSLTPGHAWKVWWDRNGSHAVFQRHDLELVHRHWYEPNDEKLHALQFIGGDDWPILQKWIEECPFDYENVDAVLKKLRQAGSKQLHLYIHHWECAKLAVSVVRLKA